jgi:hypothetical protein
LIVAFRALATSTNMARSSTPQVSPNDPQTTPVAQSFVAQPTATPVQFVTITKPVVINIPYGVTSLHAGMKLRLVSRSGNAAVVQYMGGNYSLPVTATDLQYPRPNFLLYRFFPDAGRLYGR